MFVFVFCKAFSLFYFIKAFGASDDDLEYFVETGELQFSSSNHALANHSSLYTFLPIILIFFSFCRYHSLVSDN